MTFTDNKSKRRKNRYTRQKSKKQTRNITKVSDINISKLYNIGNLKELQNQEIIADIIKTNIL